MKGRGSTYFLCDHIPAGSMMQSEMAQKSDVGKCFKGGRDVLHFGVELKNKKSLNAKMIENASFKQTFLPTTE